MKPFCIILIAWVAVPSALTAQSTIESDSPPLPASEGTRPSKVRPEVRDLLRKLGSDAPYGFEKAEFEAMQHEAATRPDILPDLWAAFEEGYLIPRREGKGGDGGSVGPLTHRKDLSAKQVQIIANELANFAALGSDERSGDWHFTINAIDLLRNYPSPQHEELVIKFLNRGGKGSYTLLHAFETLEQIGGQRGLAAMKKRLAELNVEFPEFHMIPDLEMHIAGLEARLADEGDSPSVAPDSMLPSVESSQGGGSGSNPQPAPPPLAEVRGSALAWVGGVVAFAVIAMAWLWVRLRRK